MRNRGGLFLAAALGAAVAAVWISRRPVATEKKGSGGAVVAPPVWPNVAAMQAAAVAERWDGKTGTYAEWVEKYATAGPIYTQAEILANPEKFGLHGPVTDEIFKPTYSIN